MLTMTHNLNENKLDECDTMKEYRDHNIGNMVPYEEISVSKTEVKEESCDFEMSVDDIEFVDVKEEDICFPENNFENGDLELIKSTEPFDLDLVQCEVKESIQLKNNKQYKRPIKYKCEYCTFLTDRKSNLLKHLCTDTKEKLYKCTYKSCNCTRVERESCECNTCEYSCMTQDSLNAHLFRDHNVITKRYKCNDCKFTTHFKTSLRMHIRSHGDEKPYRCTYKSCDCVGRQKEYCKCSTCEYATISISGLNKHVLSCHSGKEGKFKCDHCAYVTHWSGNLKKHIVIHNNEKPFKCSYKNCICTPGQEQFCKCEICEYATKRQSCLDEHMLTHTKKERKYKCDYCEFAANKKFNLIKHIYTHASEQPMMCDMCEYATTRKDKLQAHITAKHGPNKEKLQV